MANITARERGEDEMGPGKLCINRIAFPYEPKDSTRSYVLAAKCIPKWENCDKCICGILKDVNGTDKEMNATCQYGGQISRSHIPDDDFWGFEDCTHESLSSITIHYGWMSIEPLTGALGFDAIGRDAPYEAADDAEETSLPLATVQEKVQEERDEDADAPKGAALPLTTVREEELDAPADAGKNEDADAPKGAALPLTAVREEDQEELDAPADAGKNEANISVVVSPVNRMNGASTFIARGLLGAMALSGSLLWQMFS
ncbi:hypothetical protein ACHAWF_004162 [Thalassiosira exigua]